MISRAGEFGTVDSCAFLREIDAINQGRREYVVRLAKRLLDRVLDDKRIAVLGAAFTLDTDDVRDSPALDIALKLYSAVPERSKLATATVATEEALHGKCGGFARGCSWPPASGGPGRLDGPRSPGTGRGSSCSGAAGGR